MISDRHAFGSAPGKPSKPRPGTCRCAGAPLALGVRQPSPGGGSALDHARLAYVRAAAHAGSDLVHEVGGALVGWWWWRARRADHLVIEAVLPAPHRHGPAYLTFTQDSLVA